MPRFLAPITVAQEYVTTNETISGSETILGATSGKDSYWTTVNVVSGLSADYGSYVHNVSAAYFYGDGSNLTGISHIDNTKLPLSGGTLTNGLTGTTGIFTTSLSAPSLNGTHYGNGINLTNLNASNISTGTLSTSILPAFNGDISTTLNSTVSTTVIKLQGRPISTSTPSNGQILQWNGTAWVPGSIATGGSGGGGVTYYFDYDNYTGVSPTTGLPTSPVAPSLLGREYSVGSTSLQSAELTQNVYKLIAGFVTLSSEPAVTNIPAGLWDFNIWVDIVGNNSPNQTSMQVRVYKYASSTSTYTALASSDYVYIYDPDIIAQYIANVTMPQTTILSSDRIYIELWGAKSVNQSRAIRFWFDSNHPSHVHTTIPSVAGSGLVKTVNGVYQTPASLLVDVDVASNAAISQSKISGLTTSLAGKVNTTDVIPISAGGTGQSNAAAGLSALGGFPISGGTITDGLTANSGTFTAYLSTPSLTATSIFSNGETIVGNLTINGTLTATNEVITNNVTINGNLSGNVGTFTTSISSPSISGTYYGDASNLTNTGLSIGLPHYFIKSRSTSGANRVGVMNTGVTPNTFTFSTAGALLSADYNNYLPIVGDVVLLLNQTTQTQNGPWSVTDTGSPSTSALFTRPTWFSGTVKSGMMLSETRGLNHGATWSLYNNTVTLSTDFVVGQSNILFITAVTKAQSNAVVASNTFTGTQTLAVGTTTLAPLKFQNGTLLTTPVSGSVEWDNNNMYVTDLSANRKQVITYNDVPVFEVDGRITQLTGTLSGNTFTNSVTGALSALDTYAFAAGDSLIWYFTGTNAGLWTVTSTGSPTTSAVLTRPSYYQGTLPWSLALVGFKKGTAQGTWLQLRPNTTGTYPIIVNSTSITTTTVISPAGNASISGNTFQNTQTMVAGTNTIAPLKFQSGSLQTTPAAHSIEWDGTSLYATTSAATRKTLLYSDFSNVTAGPVNLLDGLNAGAATFTVSVSSPALSGIHYGDGSKLTGIVASGGVAIDNTKLPLSGGVLTSGLTGTTALFTNSVSAFVLSSTYYGDGTNLIGVIHDNDSRLTDSRTPTGSASGDLNGNYPNPTVAKMQGYTISTATPSVGQMLQWTGTSWTPASIPTGGSGGGGVIYYMNYLSAAQTPISGLPVSPISPRKLSRASDLSASSITSAILSQSSYDLVAGFVSDLLDPDVITIPAGIWDFNLWMASNSIVANQVIVKLIVYKYDNLNTYTSIASSDYISIYDASITTQYIASVTVPQTNVLSSDRIYVEIVAKALSANVNLTINFGGSLPSHVHTTLPSVAGSGLVKVINSVFQSPASLLVDTDVASNAAISQSKISGLTTSLAGKVNTTDVIPISSGGTGQNNAAAGLSALGGFPISGGTITDGLTANSGAFTTYLSSPSISGTHYGDGSKLTGLSASINFIIDGGGSIISTGSKGYVLVPSNFTIQQWYITSDISTVAVVDVKRATYDNLPSTTSITSTDTPSLSTSTKNRNTNITLWSGINAADYLEFYVISNTTAKLVTITLLGVKN